MEGSEKEGVGGKDLERCEGKEIDSEVENRSIKMESTDSCETQPSDSDLNNDPDDEPDPDPDSGEGPSSLFRDPMVRHSEHHTTPSHKLLEDDSDEDEDKDEDDAHKSLLWEQPLKVGKDKPMDYDDEECMPEPSQVMPMHNWDSDSDSDSHTSTISCRSPDLDDEQDDQAQDPKQKSIKKTDIPTFDECIPIDDITLILPESVELQPFGRVSGIIEKQVIIESMTDLPPVCEDSMIFKSNRHAAGKIFEIFGPVAHPFYVLRFSCMEHIERKDIKIQDIMYFAPSIQDFTRYIFTDRIRDRGSDASWKNDLEPPPEAVDYSDDEKEKAAKSKKFLGQNQKKQKAECRSKSRAGYSRDAQKGSRPEPRQLALQENREEEENQEKKESKQDNRQTSRLDYRLGAQENRQRGKKGQKKSSRHDNRHSGRQDRRQLGQHDHRQLLQQNFRQEYCPEFGQDFGGQQYGQTEFGQAEYGQQQYAQGYQEFRQEYHQEYHRDEYHAAAAAAAAAVAGYHEDYRPPPEYPPEYRPDYQYPGAYGGEAPVHWCPQPQEAGRNCYNKRESHQHKSSHSRSQEAGQFYADHRLAQDAPPSLFPHQHRQDNALMQHSYQLAPQYYDMNHYQAHHPSQHVAWSGLSQHVHNAHYQHFQGHHHARGGGHSSQYTPYY